MNAFAIVVGLEMVDVALINRFLSSLYPYIVQGHIARGHCHRACKCLCPLLTCFSLDTGVHRRESQLSRSCNLLRLQYGKRATANLDAAV